MTQRRNLADCLPEDLTIDDFVSHDGDRTRFDARAALAYLLLLEGDVYPISRRFDRDPEPDEEEEVGPETGKTIIVVNSSDTFAWGYSASENFRSDGGTDGELYDLLKCTLEDSKWGGVKWTCVRWQMQPQAPMVHEMIKDGAWDETMRALPPNAGDADCCEWHREMQASNVEMDNGRDSGIDLFDGWERVQPT